MEREREAEKREEPAAPAAEAAASAVKATVRCPYCHADVSEDDAAARCAACQTVHHPACFDERGACSVDGCGGRSAFVGKGWRIALGECASCHETVHADGNVLVCRSCDELHHPACFEKTSQCGSCSEGQALMVAGSALHAARERGGTMSGAAFWAVNALLDNVWVIYGLLFFKFDVAIGWIILLAVVVSPLLTWLRGKLQARRLATVLDVARASPLRARVSAPVKPADEPPAA